MTVRYREFAVPVDPEFARSLKAQLDARRAGRHESPKPADDQATTRPPVTEVTLMLAPDKQPDHRWRRVGLMAAAVVAVLAAGTVLVVATSNGDPDPQPAATMPPDSAAPATVAPPVAPDPQEAIALAQRFMEARDAWDGEAVRATVTDDAIITDLSVSNADDYLAGAEIERATGWRYMKPNCIAIVPGPPIQVRCTYTMQNAWSEAIGVGPFRGSDFRFVIADGQIQQVTHTFNFSAFDPQVFAVFQQWLTTTHPNDVEVMFDARSGNVSLTPEAIALFEHHTTEFVASRTEAGSG